MDIRIYNYKCDFCGNIFYYKNIKNITISDKKKQFIDFDICDNCSSKIINSITDIKRVGVSLLKYYESIVLGDESVCNPDIKYKGM